MNIPFFKKKEDTTKPKSKKSIIREWLDAGVFAIVAATIIRTFFIEAYTIPTPSMEKSLLVNDYLFVSKMHYGPRLPMTPLAIPFVHNVMPIFGGKPYSTAIQWPYKRMWGFQEVERNDDVVFNFPAGDTVFVDSNNPSYYDQVQYMGRSKEKDEYITHPTDKTDNYIKRCVAIPGDKLEVKESQLYLNEQPAKAFKFLQYNYSVLTQNNYLNLNEIMGLGILESDIKRTSNPFLYVINTTIENAEIIKKMPNVVEVKKDIIPAIYGKTIGAICFPNDTSNFSWTRDNFGPLTIPKRGATVNINLQNIALYKRLIQTYEKHDFQIKDSTILIDGKPATTYTFAMDYYWLMGDNRHESYDSRFWGFVPEDHVVGKAWFIWMSYGSEGIRWKRLFRSVKSLEE